MRYSEYKGVEHKKMPVDIGKYLFQLNWNMSSDIMSEFIYQNDDGELFHVNGVLQHTSGMIMKANDGDEGYHLVMAIKIKSMDLLVEYLSGRLEKCKMFARPRSKAIVIKLGGSEDEEHINHHDEVSDFEFLGAKECGMKRVPLHLNPTRSDTIIGLSKFELDADPCWVLISEEEKEKIKKFIKDK